MCTIWLKEKGVPKAVLYWHPYKWSCFLAPGLVSMLFRLGWSFTSQAAHRHLRQSIATERCEALQLWRSEKKPGSHGVTNVSNENWRCKLTKPSNLICWWSRCHILCINNCVSSNFLWHTLWSFLGIRHFPSDVKQMCLLWFRLVLGLQERGYVGDRSFHFGNGSSVIWRTLVFQIWRTNLSMVFLCRNLILLSQRFYKMTIWWETRILLTRNLNDCWNVNDSFGNLCAGFFSRDKTGRFGWEFSPWVYWWPLLRRTEMIDLDMGIQLFHRVFDSAVAVCHAWVVVPFSGEITKEVSREIQECEAMRKTLVG